MHNSTFGHKASRKRSHERKITFKIRVGGWLRTREDTRGTTYRVCWSVAGRRMGRTFRTVEPAISFRSMLTEAARQGQPFDVDSGLPLSMIPEPCRRAWHSRSTADGPYE